jgi:hypothetical protein
MEAYFHSRAPVFGAAANAGGMPAGNAAFRTTALPPEIIPKQSDIAVLEARVALLHYCGIRRVTLLFHEFSINRIKRSHSSTFLEEDHLVAKFVSAARRLWRFAVCIQ